MFVLAQIKIFENSNKASDCKKLFEALLKQKVVTLSNNKIIYDLELLHKVN
jgi:hypothetical protein